MAEDKKKDKKKSEHKHHSGGEMNFGVQVILFVVAIFIIWVLTGGTKKEAPKSPLLVPTPTNNTR
jgi:hypothetical protein